MFKYSLQNDVIETGFSSDQISLWVIKYHHHRNSAKLRNKITTLTFRDYLVKAAAAGITHPDQIGKEKHQYQLGRIGDVGNYTVDNCRFITTEQNILEATMNGKRDASAMIIFNTGRTIENDPRKSAAIDKLRGRNKENCQQHTNHSIRMSGRTAETHAGLAVMQDKLSRHFKAISPNGVEHMGKNLTNFCKVNDLNKSGMCSVASGRLKHYKGWIVEYVDNPETV